MSVKKKILVALMELACTGEKHELCRVLWQSLVVPTTWEVMAGA